MHRSLRLLAAAPAAVLAFALLPTPVAAQSGAASAPPSGFRDEFLGQFGMSMRKFIALARAMPADKYDWSPGAGVMPVARVYAHVARYNYGYPSTEMGLARPAGIGLDTLEERVTKKEDVVALLERSAEYVRTNVSSLTDEQLARPTKLYGRDVPQWAVLFQLLAHMNEHLGQSIAYARSNNVVPPWSQ